MDNSTGKVTNFVSSTALGTSRGRGKDDERRERKLAFTRSLVHGIARLIEGQRQFADEFGLSHSRVFPNSFEALEGQTPTQLAISLFSADWKSITDLENMFQDMIMHQVALFSALAYIKNAYRNYLKTIPYDLTQLLLRVLLITMLKPVSVVISLIEKPSAAKNLRAEKWHEASYKFNRTCRDPAISGGMWRPDG